MNRIRLMLPTADSFLKRVSVINCTYAKVGSEIFSHFVWIKTNVSNNLIKGKVETLVIKWVRRVPRFDIKERIKDFIHCYTSGALNLFVVRAISLCSVERIGASGRFTKPHRLGSCKPSSVAAVDTLSLCCTTVTIQGQV